MFNRTGQIRSRRARLQGQQLDITFPRRGRPSRIRRLERAGQMRLGFGAGCLRLTTQEKYPAPSGSAETFDQALDYLFPVRPMTEEELAAEFHRLFD